jgi:hypothetical protein
MHTFANTMYTRSVLRICAGIAKSVMLLPMEWKSALKQTLVLTQSSIHWELWDFLGVKRAGACS